MDTFFDIANGAIDMMDPISKLLSLKEGFEPTKSGWIDPSSGSETTFVKLFKDLRTAIDDIHLTSLKLKKAVIENPKRCKKTDCENR